MSTNTEQDNLKLGMIIKMVNDLLDGQPSHESGNLIINKTVGERTEEETIFYIKKNEEGAEASEIVLHINGIVTYDLHGFNNLDEITPRLLHEHLLKASPVYSALYTEGMIMPVNTQE